MRKVALFIVCAMVLGGCDKHDPILPGVRDSIFNTSNLNVLNTSVPNVPENLLEYKADDCPYTQKSDNTVWADSRKIFAGFATGNSVAGERTPMCNNGFVYAGLSTGELVKLNPRTRRIVWITDVYSPTNMTGGSSVLDIVAPIQIRGKYVYVGGLGDAFCKVSDTTGTASWCVGIGVEKPFVVTDDVAYVLDTENNLNAIRLRDGAIYWRKPVQKSRTPRYVDKKIIVGAEQFSAETGELLK